MASSDLYLNKLVYQSRAHILEMLEDRGFDVTALKNYTQEEMRVLLEKHQQGKFEQLTYLSPLDIKLKNADGATVIIKYRLDEKIKKDVLLTHITQIFKEHKLNSDTDCIIIMNVCRVLQKAGAKDDSVVGLVNLAYLDGIFTQIFGLENFMFNISRHVFVPKHTILTQAEVTKLMKDQNCRLDDLPKIKREDPMAKYIGMRPKQVVRIESINATTGVGITYRTCVRE